MRDRRRPWTDEEKSKLLELAGEDGVTRIIARKVRRPVGDCHAMYRMLKSYETLGKTTVVVENGVRITKCPPAYAHGVWSRSRF